MPFASQRQWRWAFATGKPFADRWARETPGGKGKRYRRLRARAKAKRITGNLYRADDGKFTGGSGGESAPAESEPTKGPSKRSQNAAARRERSAAEAEARATEDAAERATRDEEDAKLDGATTPKERQALRREIARARRERAAARRTARAERQAAERSARGQEDAAATEEAAKPKKDPKAEKPKKGGGGGGGGPKGDKQETPEQAAKREQVEKRRAEADKRRAAMDARRERQDAQREQDRAAREERNQRELADLVTRAQTPGMKLTDSQWERLVVEGLAQRSGATIGLTAAGQQQARRQRKGAPAPLAVFKDARGADRWLTITTTAYEDRDAEIITTKGIAYAVVYGDATGERGVLRYWHVPGMDLGPCDFQAQGGPGGRWLVESGTFYGPREAALGRAMAEKGWHMSPGFLHPRGEPYTAVVGGRKLGLYDTPMLFERSPTPPGRASNLFGRISIAKESHVNEEKKAALKELVGGDDALLADLLGRIEQSDKAAQTAGVAFKDAPEWATALLSRIEALEATTKAPMPADEMIEAGATEMADGEAELAKEEGDEGSDNLLSPGEIQAIADAVAATLMGAIDGISAKMAEVDNELKGRGYQRMKEFPAELEKLAATLATIDATVKELAGLAPARGYQGSRDNADLPAELAAMLKGDGDTSDPYADVMRFLRPAQ